jgi:spermidine/putrescine-binding protein
MDYMNNDAAKVAKYGQVKVIYETTDTNETMFNEIQTGKAHYDLICPSDYMLQKLLANDYLVPMDRNKLPNYQSFVSPYMKERLDNITAVNEVTNIEYSLSEYTAGYMWGTLGLVFNPNYELFLNRELKNYEESSLDKAVIIDEIVSGIIEDMSSYSSLWSKKYNKGISVKDSMRDTYAIGVLESHKEDLQEARNKYLNGLISSSEYNKEVSDLMNDITPETINNVTNLLSSLKNNVFGLEVDSGKQDIVTGKIGINFAWSGDAVYSIYQASDTEQVSDPFDLLYSVPELGSNIWFDGWCIPKNENRSDLQYDLAHEFVDFLSHPYNAAQNVDYIGYTSFVGGPEMLDLYRDYYDNRTDLIYRFDEDDNYYSLYYESPTTFEEVEVGYNDVHHEADSLAIYDDVDLYYYDENDLKVNYGKYNEDLLIDETWEEVDLEYFFLNTLGDEYSEEDYIFYSDNYLPYINKDGSKNVSVGGAFFCQLPDEETMNRCAVMRDFGKQNETILQMWENFKSDPLPSWAIVLFAIEITTIVGFVLYYFLGKNIKHRLRKKRKLENK